jgi:large conductance mechanosensitive channel
MLKEFKEFAMQGSLLDMAIGIIIGAAFGEIVNSLVNDILMPPIGLLVGGIDFSQLKIILAETAEGPVVIGYGMFINAVISFIIVAFAIFLLVRQVNRMKRAGEKPPDTKDCPFCLSTIPIKATRCAHCTSEVAAG